MKSKHMRKGAGWLRGASLPQPGRNFNYDTMNGASLGVLE
jgi:hypothetical protein